MRIISAAAVAGLMGFSILTTVPSQAADSDIKRVVVNGKKLNQAEAKVKQVVDGDTLQVDVQGDNSGPFYVRNSGINTMEKGQCHYKEATRQLKRLAGKKILLRYAGNSSKLNKSSGRIRKQMSAFTRKGKDLQNELVKRGLAFPYNFGTETLNSDLYLASAQLAAQQGRGLFDVDACGVGPQAEAQLDLVVNYDSGYKGRENLSKKFVRLVNNGPVAVNLGGWRLSTGRSHFAFPRRTVVPLGGEVVVRMGRGQNTATEFFWGGGRRELAVPGQSRYSGNGVYLIDPDGDARFWNFHPCAVDCTHPVMGKISISVNYDPPGSPDLPNQETVSFLNTGDQRVDLTYLVAEVRYSIYEFPKGTYLDPGETAVIRMGKGTQGRLDHYLGRSSRYLPGEKVGGLIQLRDDRDVELTCVSWGRKSKC